MHNVVGPGERYDDAYFEIKYVRAYTTGGVAPTPTAAAVAIAAPSAALTHTPIGTQLVPSSLFYPGGAVGLHMERGAGIGVLLVTVGVVMGCVICL
ncbi:hypothetical protein C0991_006467 [Blastosporella zonata]|nr:hypothetical protein C0991_006467 [Blastosporella zonata]